MFLIRLFFGLILFGLKLVVAGIIYVLVCCVGIGVFMLWFKCGPLVIDPIDKLYGYDGPIPTLTSLGIMVLGAVLALAVVGTLLGIAASLFHKEADILLDNANDVYHRVTD